MDTTSMLVSVTFITASSPVALAGVRAYRLYGRARLVTCPETAEAVLVKIHATRAIASKLAGGNKLPLRSCSRWPERKGCDQACVNQLRASPGGCRPRPPAGKFAPNGESRGLVFGGSPSNRENSRLKP